MTVTPARFVASLFAAAVFSACAGKAPESAATSVPAASGPASALVSAAGSPAAPALTPELRRDLDAAVASEPAALRPRLRYALAGGDDRKVHLVVYDGEGLGADGKHKGHPHDYTLFKVLNATHGEHYDPQQNALVAAIPPPPEREKAEVLPGEPASQPSAKTVKIP